MYANYHTHTYRCSHASGTEEEYIKTAIENGIKIMGFSDHIPLIFPDGHQSKYRVQYDDAKDYIDTIKELREKYKEKIKIHIGFEMEYYPLYFDKMLEFAREYGAEYLILGQHFIRNEYPNGVLCSGRDNDEKLLVEYVDTIIEGMKTGVFLYVAHPDMFLYNESEEIYRREAERLCFAAKEMDIPLEINLLGIYGNRHYPNKLFWEQAGKVGCKVILGFDAHSANRAYDGESLKIAQALVKKYKLNLIDEIEIKDI